MYRDLVSRNYAPVHRYPSSKGYMLVYRHPISKSYAFIYRYIVLRTNPSVLLRPFSLLILGTLHLFYESPSIIFDAIAAIKHKDQIIATVIRVNIFLST